MRAEILIRQRIPKLMIVLVALFGAIAVRIVSLTVIQGDELTARSVRQWTQQGKLAAQRGSIMDRIGGKTGTAQVYIDGKVSGSVHIGSFIGFAPADNPRFAVLVIVNAADVPVDYGGTTAAPFARQIMADTLAYLGIPKADAAQQKQVTVPEVTGMTLDEAARTLRAIPLKWETDGVSATVTGQMPPAGAALTAGGQVMLYTAPQDAVTPEIMAAVPDVRGMSVVEASRALRARGFELRLEGSGIAAKQIPAAGTFAPQGASVTVTFAMP